MLGHSQRNPSKSDRAQGGAFGWSHAQKAKTREFLPHYGALKAGQETQGFSWAWSTQLTFSKGLLEQVMLSLQLGDKITAIHIFFKFLENIRQERVKDSGLKWWLPPLGFRLVLEGGCKKQKEKECAALRGTIHQDWGKRDPKRDFCLLSHSMLFKYWSVDLINLQSFVPGHAFQVRIWEHKESQRKQPNESPLLSAGAQ